jgi:transcriptional regulator GlxA family with amidase domain
VELRLQTNLPSIRNLRAATSPAGVLPFRVGIVIGPGFIPMDMVGIQAVFGLMPGAEIHLLWKSTELVEGFPDWWTKPTTAFADCPTLDVIAVPMLAPEVQNDPEVISFVKSHGTTARYIIGICNGVVLLGAAGLLEDKRVTTSYNSLPFLSELGAKEVVTHPSGVVIHDNLYTAGPGVGSFEAALWVVERAFGKPAGQLAELIIEYVPHAPFGTGTAKSAGSELVGRFEGLMSGMISQYREGAVKAFQTWHGTGPKVPAE